MGLFKGTSLLKGFAIAAGAGLGVCVGAVLLAPAPRKTRRPEPGQLSEAELLKLDPILDRLERLEAWVDASASAPVAPARVADLEMRAEAALVQVRNSFEGLREDLPALVDATVGARVAELEIRLQADARASWDRAVVAFEHTIEQKVNDRIGSLERALSEQSSAIASLRASAAETDVNLQRLIVSINRLCEVAPTVPPTPAPRPPEPIVAGRPQLVKESERESKRPRIPMSRIFGALLAFGLSRLLS
jgi:uncharacterized coiled-coil protein SlyX